MLPKGPHEIRIPAKKLTSQIRWSFSGVMTSFLEHVREGGHVVAKDRGKREFWHCAIVQWRENARKNNKLINLNRFIGISITPEWLNRRHVACSWVLVVTWITFYYFVLKSYRILLLYFPCSYRPCCFPLSTFHKYISTRVMSHCRPSWQILYTDGKVTRDFKWHDRYGMITCDSDRVSCVYH